MNMHDMMAIENSKELAMVEIENMEDYDTVKVLIGNAEDIAYRAKERLEVLLPTRTAWDKEFTVHRDGVDYKATWLEHESRGQNRRCYTCNELVLGNEPRLRVRDAPKATATIGSHGVLNEWNCIDCAKDFYGTEPPA